MLAKIQAIEAFCKGVYPSSHQVINYQTNEGSTALLLAAQEGKGLIPVCAFGTQ